MASPPYNFLLFDAAKAESALWEAQRLNPKHRSLYMGSAQEELEEVAPYLFEIQHQTPFSDWFLANGWNDSWGVLLYATLSFEEMYRHFRKFLMVKTEDGEQLYFRFYDPRVLRIFLPTCDTGQIIEFFGPVKLFLCEDEDPDFILVFSHYQGNLKVDRMPNTFMQTNTETI